MHEREIGIDMELGLAWFGLDWPAEYGANVGQFQGTICLLNCRRRYNEITEIIIKNIEMNVDS